ncbi:hypothetical protein [Dactylosporangium salmoneum]|uniref:Uncharacterized protein n=1 Tax=Dactylosporangium salmoneum TaxID=53361 RepID=A0ABN3FBE8_9ACTN
MQNSRNDRRRTLLHVAVRLLVVAAAVTAGVTAGLHTGAQTPITIGVLTAIALNEVLKSPGDGPRP